MVGKLQKPAALGRAFVRENSFVDAHCCEKKGEFSNIHPFCTSRFGGFEAVHLVAIVCNGKLLKVGGRHELKVESWNFERELKVGSRSCSCSKVKEHWSFSL